MKRLDSRRQPTTKTKSSAAVPRKNTTKSPAGAVSPLGSSIPSLQINISSLVKKRPSIPNSRTTPRKPVELSYLAMCGAELRKLSPESRRQSLAGKKPAATDQANHLLNCSSSASLRTQPVPGSMEDRIFGSGSKQYSLIVQNRERTAVGHDDSDEGERGSASEGERGPEDQVAGEGEREEKGRADCGKPAPRAR